MNTINTLALIAIGALLHAWHIRARRIAYRMGRCDACRHNTPKIRRPVQAAGYTLAKPYTPDQHDALFGREPQVMTAGEITQVAVLTGKRATGIIQISRK